MANEVVSQHPWTAVKQRVRDGYTSYDMWEWNVWKMKWVRLANTGCGFGRLSDADRCALERSNEIAAMLANNAQTPPPL